MLFLCGSLNGGQRDQFVWGSARSIWMEGSGLTGGLAHVDCALSIDSLHAQGQTSASIVCKFHLDAA